MLNSVLHQAVAVNSSSQSVAVGGSGREVGQSSGTSKRTRVASDLYDGVVEVQQYHNRCWLKTPARASHRSRRFPPLLLLLLLPTAATADIRWNSRACGRNCSIAATQTADELTATAALFRARALELPSSPGGHRVFQRGSRARDPTTCSRTRRPPFRPRGLPASDAFTPRRRRYCCFIDRRAIVCG
jgi:hypothetical protein